MYLNKSKRENLIKILCLVSELEDTIKLDLDKDDMKNMKAGHTFLNKAMTGIMSKLERDHLDRLRKDASASEFLVLPKNRAKIEKDEWEKLRSEDQCVVNLDNLFTCAEKAMYWCRKCDEKDQNRCELRGVLESLDMPHYDEDQKCVPTR